jgi:hypothetical protein
MPLAQVTLLKGKSNDYLSSISRSIHDSLVSAYGMDDRDRFQIFSEVEPGRLIFSPDYAGGPRSNDFLIVNIVSMPRTKESKEALYHELAARLARSPGIRKEDLFVYIADHLALEDISFANGISALELSKRLGREK